MQRNMAAGAALITRVDHAVRIAFWDGNAAIRASAEVACAGVTLEAKHSNGGPHDHLDRGGTVGLVAGDAAIDFASLVRKDEGTSLVDMALEAGLFVAVGLLEHLGVLTHGERWREATVRIVAVTARHEAFIDAVFERKIELGANTAVALVTKVALVGGRSEERRVGKEC